MSLTFGAPAWLWLLAAMPLVWAAWFAARTNFNRHQRVAQALVRSALLAALAFALARPVIATASGRLSVVYAVDVSHSVSSRTVAAAADRIDELNRSMQPAHAAILTFGGRTRTAASTADLRQAAEPGADTRNDAALDRGRTDLEAALLAARAALAPGHVPRIVIFSDGWATAGDTGAALARLAADRIPVSVEPLAPRTIGDAWIDALSVPERVTAGAPFTAAVTVATQRATSCDIRLLDGATEIGSARAELAPGLTVVPIEATVGTLGAHRLEARIATPGDPLAINNAHASTTWADPRPRVLYVEGRPASARYLAGALGGAGFDVTVRPPAGIPAAPSDLDPFDVVILSDVGRDAIPDATMAALTDWVEVRGGGLLVAGGEAIFGEQGYRETPLERLTPVTFERKDEPEVALVIVLDRSWSMAGASMELTKTAAQAAVDVLDDQQLIGILTFNDKFAWDVTLRNVGRNRDAIRTKISAIGPGGHTLIFPAVEQAYLALRNAKARAKHVILLSDGRSYPGEYEALVQKMVEARITMSTVAVGPSADPELLQNLAGWGKGRFYAVADATKVPEIFVKEAKSAATPAFDERSITPVVKTPGFLTGVDLQRLPALKGHTATVLKDDALELLATDEEDPLLAFWPIGLGRTAVFASDVKDRWAANWVTWRGYGPFFASVVRALQRQRTPAFSLDVVEGPVRAGSRTIRIAVEAREPDGRYRNLANPTVEVRAAGAPVPLPTRQVAPGRYEATVLADAGQPLSVALAGAAPASGVTTRTVLPDPAAEYRFRPPDEALLQSIAASTGGFYKPTAQALTNAAGDVRTERRSLLPAMLVLALLLWCADIVLRRIRIFEPRGAD